MLCHRALFLSLIASLLVVSQSFAADEKPKPPATVFAKKVELKKMAEVLTFPARVQAKVSTTVLAETDGIVSKITAPLGQPVKRGATLLTITHTDPTYQYAPVRVQSPVSGVVSLLEVTEGSQVARTQKLVQVTDPSQITISIEVPAQDLSSIQRGMKGEFALSGSAPGAKPISIVVAGVSPFVNPATGTAMCELQLEAGVTSTLPPGVLGQVSFNVNQRMGISIPEQAIVYRGTETLVRVLEEGKVRKIAVTLGRKQRGDVEVLGGLTDKMTYVERTSRFVADGETVTVGTEASGS